MLGKANTNLENLRFLGIMGDVVDPSTICRSYPGTISRSYGAGGAGGAGGTRALFAPVLHDGLRLPD